MASSLLFKPSARRDLDRIESWIAERNPLGAANVIADIYQALQLLREQPRMGRRLSGRPVRSWVTSRYRYIILYQISGDNLIVRAIYHPRRSRPLD